MELLDLTGAWQFAQVGKKEWMPANVPGGVHTDLLALERIPDPFVGDNELKVAWVAKEDWQYRRSFDASPSLLSRQQVWLVADGLDTLARVTLNGRELGETDNMYRQYRWDVKKLLKPSGNELVITFFSTVNLALDRQAKRPLAGVSQAIPGGPHVRKAPCQFGWDWGPQLPPIGIWKDIRLEAYDHARIADVHLRQQHTGKSVSITANIKLDGTAAGLLAQLRVTTPNGEVFQVSGDPTSKLEVTILNPQLWWPNGYGQQPLYQVQVLLQKGTEVIDDKRSRLGLRTVELIQKPDQWGKSFTFAVNGVKIWAKGANWIPADSFPTRNHRASLEGLIRSATQAHQNMLRVWGGGFYEDETFYDLCDEYGVLIWQDFIFSCSIYPLEDAAFLANLEVEVAQNVARLRHHASLALWCGNNEMEQGWAEWGWNKPELFTLRDAYHQFFHKILPAWVANSDPDHTYWPSSPSSDIPFEDPNGQVQGDAHYWEVWHRGKPFTAYRDQFPRFMSEFGFQALPPIETIATYAEPKDWNMTSYIMERHQKNDHGNVYMVSQLLDTFQLPKDFDSLVYLSMVLQAEGIRYGVEHWRRFPERVSGTIYWQLNDCWPVASWSSLDYFGRWKALHYAAKRFYAPLLLSIEDAPPFQKVSVTNDATSEFAGKVEWSLQTLAGKILKSGNESVKVAAQSHKRVVELDFSSFATQENKRDLVFVARLFQGSNCIATQTAFFVATKHIQLSSPEIQTIVSESKGLLQVELKAATLARLVECKFEGVDAVLSDNYFDLPAGQIAVITTRMPAGWDLEKARVALRVRSVYDSYDH